MAQGSTGRYALRHPPVASSELGYPFAIIPSMVRALGFRAETKQVYWAVVDGSQRDPRVFAHDKAAAPIEAAEAAALAWYRERARYLIETYNPTLVAIRFPEANARGRGEAFRQRLRIEGVLLEAIHSCGLTPATGALPTIGARLGTKSANAKKYIESGHFREHDMSDFSRLARDAIVAAIALLPKANQ